MKLTNLPSGATRQANVGLVWKEVLNGAGGLTFELDFQQTFRVSAGANVTVTIDGVLAMTLRSGEVEYFNVGAGASGNGKSTVKVIIGTGDARVQVAQEKDPGRRTR
jgi:hypothetical protein